MFNKIQIILLLLVSFQGLAQTSVSGYVNLEEVEPNSEIHLSQVEINDLGNTSKFRDLAKTSINNKGFFEFKKSLFSDKEKVYEIFVERFENALKDTSRIKHTFLLSNKDSIYFKKTKIPFTNYTNSNLADNEFQKLWNFERQLRRTDSSKEDSLSDAYLGDLKSYTKDSLQILMVKLISIKQLDNKNLLEKDISKNPDYYVALLSELKVSDISRSDYLFLENKLAFLTTDIVETKYATSKIINIFLVFAVISLVFIIIRSKNIKNDHSIVDLSKQEKNIQVLILEGKTNKEIANELFISLSTVKTHITNIYNKLHVANRQELMRKTQNS